MTRLEMIEALQASSFSNAPLTGVIRGCALIEVIHVQFNRGLGVEGDPVRVVDQYWTKLGVLLAEKDAYDAN